MQMQQKWLGVVVVGLLCLMPLAVAEDADWPSEDSTSSSAYPAPPEWSSPGGQPTQTIPYESVAPKAVRPSFLMRLFGRAPQKLNPPILQPQKAQPEPPRQTAVSGDPLFRLYAPLSYQGQTLAPGFYLLQLGADKKQLVVLKQGQSVLTLPVASCSEIKTSATTEKTGQETQNDQQRVLYQKAGVSCQSVWF